MTLSAAEDMAEEMPWKVDTPATAQERGHDSYAVLSGTGKR
jgi:hypothetical protein